MTLNISNPAMKCQIRSSCIARPAYTNFISRERATVRYEFLFSFVVASIRFVVLIPAALSGNCLFFNKNGPVVINRKMSFASMKYLHEICPCLIGVKN